MRSSGAAPFGEALVEHRAVVDDLVLGGERRCRQDACAQLVGRDRRGAALADHDGGGRIGDAHRDLEVGARGQHDGERRHHRVAGARDVPHLDRIGRHVDRRAAAPAPASCPSSLRVTSTALLPTILIELHARPRRRPRRVATREPRRLGELLAVRRDDGRAAIDRIVGGLRDRRSPACPPGSPPR